jgi:hypothetical protein
MSSDFESAYDSAHHMNIIRVEEWYRVFPVTPETEHLTDGEHLRAFNIAVYDHGGKEVVITSEAAARVLMHQAEADGEAEEGDWVLLTYEEVAEAMLAKGWSLYE